MGNNSPQLLSSGHLAQQQQQQPPLPLTAETYEIGDASVLLQAMLEQRKDVLRRVNRKRKAPIDNSQYAHTALSTPARTTSRARGMSQYSDSSDSSGANSPPESVYSYDSKLTALSPRILANRPVILDDGVFDHFLEYVPSFSPELMDEICASMSGWNPTTMTMAPPRPSTLESPSNQELMQIYLKVSAKRLADASPSYIDLFRKYIPAMAHDSPALMEAILALAALQIGLMRKNENIVAMDAPSHYQKALRHHLKSLMDPEERGKDALLATSIIMSHYEIWNGENVKMGVHMLGGRDIILARGKAAHTSPVGRALYAAFKRLDIATSSISGNPTFMTNDWWTVDPLSRVPITEDSPTLLVADAAFSKLCVICCKLTYLKAWATRRRRDLWLFAKGNPSPAQKNKLDTSIDKRVMRTEAELDEWSRELPAWFDALASDPVTGENGEEEDVNSTQIAYILPRRYPHISIALIRSWAIGVRLQLYRIRYPDVAVIPPKLGALCHALLRMFAFLPSSADAGMVVPLFSVGMELRQKFHQEWLSNILQERITETGFHGINFARDGLRYSWLKLDGLNSGRFIGIKEGAASKIEGISENLWSAEGMLGSFEKLSLYDSPDTNGERNNFKGDIDIGDVMGEEDYDHDHYEHGLPSYEFSSSSSPEEVKVEEEVEKKWSPSMGNRGGFFGSCQVGKRQKSESPEFVLLE